MAMMGVVALVVFSFDYPLVRYLSNVERDRIVTSMERDAYVLGAHQQDRSCRRSGESPGS